ncbi:hypothetical protein GCM10023169_00320 [Georgenia halophila]|uniref:DUF4031 domain-containing protein n=1 Tax=Georgenia halophila TaxID=620889 RepID=A0ABP8KSL2_9MICO
MAILLDPPRWPAHGTVWAHLVSDVSLEELHLFARANGVPARSFDLDHYDVPAERVDELVAAGAAPVSGRELVLRLRGSGLRVLGAERRRERLRRRTDDLRHRWHQLGDDLLTTGPAGGTADASAPDRGPEWAALGVELLRRWDEPHRRYHDLAHLTDVLQHLDVLESDGEAVDPAVRLAAWFHDAVYDGEPGTDEERSAKLAGERLTGLTDPSTVAEVERLVRLTASHTVTAHDPAGAALSDADLGILAAPRGRYDAYVLDVRAEYGQVASEDFRRGRADLLRRLLDHPNLYTTAAGRARWEERARANLAAELAGLGSAGHHRADHQPPGRTSPVS